MQLFTNNATSVLAAGITNVATSLSISSGDGAKFPNPSGGDYFLLTLYKLSGITETSYEIVKCTARSADTFTIVRGQEGTSATAYATGDSVALRLTAGSMTTEAVPEGPTNKYFTTSKVLATVLTGLSVATNQVVSATDSVVTAIGYLQKQISDAVTNIATKAASASPSFTGTASFVAMKETKITMSGTSIDLATGALFTKTISGATTLSVSNVPASGSLASFVLDLTNGGSATITWWSGIKWPGGIAPTLTVAGRDVLGFFTHDGGTTWTGLILGKDIK